MNFLLTTIQMSFYPLLIIFLLLFLGYGLTFLLTPSKLRSFSFWLMPWFAMVFIIFSYVILGFFGFSVRTYSFIAIPFLILLNLYVFIKNKRLSINISYIDIIIFLFITINIIFNLSPLIKRDKIMTTVSFGNNDIIIYVQTADYLVNHSLFDNFSNPQTPFEVQHDSASHLIQALFRWGQVIIAAFFINIFNLQAYQLAYVLQTVIFALTIPLLYLISKLIYKKQSFFSIITILTIIGFNVNLLYILYHNFFGQVQYWGLQLFILFFVFSYFYYDKIKLAKYNLYDLIIGVSLSVLYFSYHEGAVFIIAPLIIFFLIKLVLRDNIFFYGLALIKIFLTTFLISSYSTFLAVVQDYRQSFGGDHTQVIGWQLFRQHIPFANPFEMMGLYSIHSFEPLPNVIAIALSLMVIFLVIKGISAVKPKALIFSFIFIYISSMLFTGYVDNNFFTYNRAVTYSVFLFLILFITGITHVFYKREYLKIFIFLTALSLIIFSAVKLNKRFLSERFTVDKKLISIQEIPVNKYKEPIFIESYLDKNIILWNHMWQYHFMYFIKPNPKIFPPAELGPVIPDNGLVLVSKPTPWYRPPQVLLKKVVWENEYYRLGRLCNSDECLIGRKEDLSKVEIGKDHYEDSLLMNGWSVKEAESRWAVGKESTLRLITKKDNNTSLVIKGLTLKEPQELSIYIDDQFIGKKTIKIKLQEYNFNLQNTLSKGAHYIKFVFSNTYRPIDSNISADTRELAVQFKKIEIK